MSSGIAKGLHSLHLTATTAVLHVRAAEAAFSTAIAAMVVILVFQPAHADPRPGAATPAGPCGQDTPTLPALCTPCPPTSICIGKGCSRINRSHDGHPSGCEYCHCFQPSPKDQALLKFQKLRPDRMYYHLHMSKTGGTTFEVVQRKIVAPYAGLAMCDEALNRSFKHPFADPPFFAPPAQITPATCQLVSAEGRMLDVKKQFSGVHPQIFTFLRHPTLRTWSQWHHDRRYWVKRGDAVPAPVSAHPHGAQGGNGHGDTDASASKAAAATLSHLYSDPALTANLDGQAYRYGNWQLYGLARAKLPPATTRTDTAFLAVKDGLNDLAFVGIAEYYRVSLCLFYFTFQLHDGFKFCRERPLHAYNAACYDNGTTNRDCKHGEHFTNKFKLSNESGLLKDVANAIPAAERALIEEHTVLDMELYTASLDIFWRRVALMAKITHKTFAGMPIEYRL